MKYRKNNAITSKMPLGFALHKFIKDEDNQPYDYIYIDINSTFEQITGLKSSNVIGKKVTEVIPDLFSDKFNWIEAYAKVAYEGESFEIERFFHPLNAWYRINAYQPEYGYFVTIFDDITDKKEAEQQLEIFKTISDNALYGKAMADIYGNLTYINKFFANIHGYEPEKLIGKPMSVLHNEKQLTVVNKLLKQLFEVGEFETQEVWHKHKNGTEFPMAMSGVMIRNAKGEPMCIAASAVDITKEKQIEESLIKLNNEYEKVMEGVQNAMFLLKLLDDGSFRFVRNNAYHQNKTGIKLEQIENKSPQELLGKEAGDIVERNYLKCVIAKESITYEEDLNLPAGKRTWLTTLTPIMDKGEVTHVVGSAIDITEIKEKERRIEQLKKEFETVFEGSQDSMYLVEVVDSETYKYILVNSAADELTGVLSEEIIGKTPREAFGDRIGNDISLKFKECYELRQRISYEAKRDFESKVIDVYVVLTPIIEDEKVKYLVGSSRDITKDKENLKKIEYLSYYDQLTGLYNRRYFEEELKKISKPQYLPISLIMADLNGLKLFNDGFGHKKGDELLIEAGQIITKNTPEESIVARTGGDEFVVILSNTDYEEAIKIRNRLELACEEVDVSPLVLSLAFGVATRDSARINIEKIIQEAENDMYRDKLSKSPSIRGKTLTSIMSDLHEKSPLEEKHSSRVSCLSERLAIALELDDKSIKELKLAGFLHDIGKITIALNILDKAEKLNEEEWLVIKKHPEVGYRILSATSDMAEIAKYVLMHHERVDGKGYPQGLKGSEIPLQAKVITIADAYESMTGNRPYKRKMSKNEAIEELRRCAGSQFDSTLVKVFIEEVLPKEETSVDKHFCLELP